MLYKVSISRVKKSSLLQVMTLKTAAVVESVQLIIIEANQLAILQVWLRV